MGFGSQTMHNTGNPHHVFYDHGRSAFRFCVEAATLRAVIESLTTRIHFFVGWKMSQPNLHQRHKSNEVQFSLALLDK